MMLLLKAPRGVHRNPGHFPSVCAVYLVCSLPISCWKTAPLARLPQGEGGRLLRGLAVFCGGIGGGKKGLGFVVQGGEVG